LPYAAGVPDGWERSRDVITTDLDDELVLLEPATGALFSLNEVGRVIWNELATASSIALIASAVTEVFEIDEATAEADVRRLVAELAEAGLVRDRSGSCS
jgi:hypothetical protein